ncbi:DUF305 domain-containing protein [Streptomyces sp. NPDC101733]|uniref:DUF305 domain-containing protein n=1 Tax=unclassified Streptomyces TaxID=2593676 RepID=UPI0038200841
MDMANALLGRFLAAALTAGLLLALTGCEDGGAKASGDGSVVVAPGRPGEEARVLSPEQAARERPDDTPNAADRAYVRHMIEHHRQALTMSAQAPDRASADGVKRLAERIAAAQAPEIGAMEKWLARHPLPTGAASPQDHSDHAAMPGMATEQQLEELGRAQGPDFDRLFLKLMTAHHEGAVKMAGEALAGGNNVAVEEMATELVATQTAEIHRMRAMG